MIFIIPITSTFSRSSTPRTWLCIRLYHLIGGALIDRTRIMYVLPFLWLLKETYWGEVFSSFSVDSALPILKHCT